MKKINEILNTKIIIKYLLYAIAILFILLVISWGFTIKVIVDIFKYINQTALRNFLELIYFICTPILTIIAFFGLKQISVSKESAKISAKRDAIKITIEYCKYFNEVVIELSDKFNDKISEQDCENITNDDFDIYFEDNKYIIKFKDGYLTEEKISLFEESEISSLSIKVLNSIEPFAIMIISGAGDDELAYRSFGRIFCEIVAQCIYSVQDIQDGSYYNELISLYDNWDRRLKNEVNIERQKKLQESILPTESFNTVGL